MKRFAPARTARLLQGLIARTDEIVQGICRSIIVVKSVELKIMLARHLYDDVQMLLSFKARVRELDVEKASSEHTRRPSGDTLPLVDGEQLISVIYHQLKSDLGAAAAEVQQVVHPLWDEPSSRLLDRCARIVDAQKTQLFGLLSAMSAPLQNLSSSTHALPAGLPDLPGRPDDFLIVAGVPRPPKESSAVTLKSALLHYLLMSTEIPTIEHCAALIFDFGRDYPPQFIEDMARQCWDEARHAQACIDALRSLDHAPGDFPIEMTLWRMTAKRSLPLRLCIHQRIGEWLGLDAALWWAERFEREGDVAAADMFGFIARDELLHVTIGNKWLRSILRTEEAIREVQLQAEEIRREYGAGGNANAPFPIQIKTCIEAGFTLSEIESLASARSST